MAKNKLKRHPFCVVIPSAKADNLVPCVLALVDAEPILQEHPERVIVVEDGCLDVSAKRRLAGVTWTHGIKPFVFPRNINLGVQMARSDTDIVVMNDDAVMLTPGGLSRISAELTGRSDYGVISAAIQGDCGNPEQRPSRSNGLRTIKGTAIFCCVMIRRSAWEQVGPMDEIFTDYGFDDDDYCRRVRLAGLEVGVHDGCLVDHGTLHSTYRGGPGKSRWTGANKEIYLRKWSSL